jgi:hypothetical protein
LSGSSTAGSLPATTDRILVEFPATGGYRSVGRLVLGGLLSRFDLPVDRVEDLLLALESLLLQELSAETVALEATAAADGVELRLGPFAGSRLADPAIARVLTRLVDDVTEETADGGGTLVALRVSADRLRRDG